MQRADQRGKVGPVKSEKSLRTIELGPDTVRDLRIWMTTETIGDLFLPSETGGVWSYGNFWHRFWVPLLNVAGVVADAPASKTVRRWSVAQSKFKQPKFGPHALRHVYASMQIEQGVTPKRLQMLMGHSTISLTMDTYGHLWPDVTADRILARAVENSLTIKIMGK
jgi:integrase